METTLDINNLTTQEAAFAGGILGTAIVATIAIGIILLIAGWRIFEKAGEKGWKILIPIYDLYILFKICGIKNWFWAFFCISIICSVMMSIGAPTNIEYIEDWSGIHIDMSTITWNDYPVYLSGMVISCAASIVAEVMVAIKLAKAFGKGLGYTFGIIFFPYIFTMILGFGKAKYSAKNLK